MLFYTVSPPRRSKERRGEKPIGGGFSHRVLRFICNPALAAGYLPVLSIGCERQTRKNVLLGQLRIII